jgi:2-iminobutanoate/2-iminopropanoate deaminase
LYDTVRNSGAVAVFIVFAWGGIASSNCYAERHKHVNLAGGQGLPFRDGVIAGKPLYVAGQEGSDEEGKLAAGGIAAETKAALENIQKVLKTAGFEMSDIVSVTVYLADIREFGNMNKVYKEIMPDPKPARARIQAAALVNHARIEVSVIAVKQSYSDLEDFP